MLVPADSTQTLRTFPMKDVSSSSSAHLAAAPGSTKAICEETKSEELQFFHLSQSIFQGMVINEVCDLLFWCFSPQLE